MIKLLKQELGSKLYWPSDKQNQLVLDSPNFLKERIIIKATDKKDTCARTTVYSDIKLLCAF